MIKGAVAISVEERKFQALSNYRLCVYYAEYGI